MAIDMIERNELSALANSRVGGLKQFVDDKNQNFVNANGYVDLFGSRKKKKTAARQAVEDKYMNFPADCSGIDKSIAVINSDLEILIGRSNTAKGQERMKVKEQIDETTKVLGEFKNRRIQLDCNKGDVAAQSEKNKSELADIVTQLGGADVPQNQGAKSPMNKWLLYGGIGLGVVLIVVVLVKARNK